jgi:hypothetical protein
MFMFIVNIGQMLTGLRSRIMTTGFDIDWSQTYLFFYKFRYYCFQVCTLTSMTCTCLATIDQIYYTVQRLAHRTLLLVRRELDKQLTVMVLLLVLFSFFTILPYRIVYILSTIPQFSTNPIIAAQIQFAVTLTMCLVYLYLAVSVQRFIFTDE